MAELSLVYTLRNYCGQSSNTSTRAWFNAVSFAPCSSVHLYKKGFLAQTHKNHTVNLMRRKQICAIKLYVRPFWLPNASLNQWCLILSKDMIVNVQDKSWTKSILHKMVIIRMLVCKLGPYGLTVQNHRPVHICTFYTSFHVKFISQHDTCLIVRTHNQRLPTHTSLQY